MAAEGYLLLATGPANYVDMARSLAASLRVMDGTRRICLVHDESHRPITEDRRFFDDYAILASHPLYPGFMNKIRLFGTAPYDRTMFVDVDSLLLKPDIDQWWEIARPHAFAITGRRKTSGEWKGADVAGLLAQERAPYLVQMNSGVFCFDRSSASETFFSGMNDFYRRRRSALGIGLHRGKPAQTDEIYIGLWMGLTGKEPVKSQVGTNTWMNSTWRAFGYTLDPAKRLVTVRKPLRSTFGIPNPLLGWQKTSPSIVHFVGLKPRSSYLRLAEYFRAAISEPTVSQHHRAAMDAAGLSAALG